MAAVYVLAFLVAIRTRPTASLQDLSALRPERHGSLRREASLRNLGDPGAEVEQGEDLTNNMSVTHFVSPLVNNLGGLGPDSGEPMLYFPNFTWFHSHEVDLKITNITEYTPGKPKENGMHGDFLMISVKSGTNVSLCWQLFEGGTNIPYDVTGLSIDGLDFDTGADGMSTEKVIVDGLTSYSVSKKSEISVTKETGTLTEKTSFQGTKKGTSSDNPEDANSLTDQQLARAASFHFDGTTSKFFMTLVVSPKGHGGRNFIFAGQTPVSTDGVEVFVQDVMGDPYGESAEDPVEESSPTTTTTTTTHNATEAIEAAKAVVEAAEADPSAADPVQVASAAAAVVAASSNATLVAQAASNAAELANSSQVDAAIAAATAAIREAEGVNSTSAATPLASPLAASPLATTSVVATTTALATTTTVITTTTMMVTTTTPSPQVAAVAAAEPDAVSAAVAAAAANPDDPAGAVQAAVEAAVASTKEGPGELPRGDDATNYVVIANLANTNTTAGCPECNMGQTFNCAGFVRYGYAPQWTRWFAVGNLEGDLYCSTEWFQSFGVLDPWPIHGKVCQCMQRTGGVCGAASLFRGLWWPILWISLVYLLYWFAQFLGRKKSEDLFVRTLHRAESASFVAPMICAIFLVSYKVPDPFVADTGDMSAIKHRECAMVAILFSLQVLFNIYKEWDHVQQMKADEAFEAMDLDNDGQITRDEFMQYYWRKMHGVQDEKRARELKKEEDFTFLPNAWAVVRGLLVIMMYTVLFMTMLRVWFQSAQESNSSVIRSLADPDYTGFRVAVRMASVYFAIYAMLEVATLAGLVKSQAVLKLAALSFSHGPVLVVLIVTIQAASFAGGAIMPSWVRSAMLLAEFGIAGQVVGSFLMPMFFEYSLCMTSKGNPDLILYGRRAMEVVNLLRWLCIAFVYMAVYYLLKALAELPSAPDCALGPADVQWIIFWTILTYYACYAISWVMRAYEEFRQDGQPIIGKDGHLSPQHLLFLAVGTFLFVDIAANNGADWTAAIVGAVCLLFACIFAVAENLEIKTSPDGAKRMSSLHHVYMCGREWLEWIPTASCLMLAYFLINADGATI